MFSLKFKILLVLVFIFFCSCNTNTPYTIEKGSVGLLSESTLVNEFPTLFKNDSIVTKLFDENNKIRKGFFTLEDDLYFIYSKSGEKLLEIAVATEKDSISKIRCVQIFDIKYTTKKGISLKSTFKEIKSAYKINKIESTLTSATLFIDDLNATIAIDKKDLGMLNFTKEEITIDQIPEHAKIKFFTIWFN